MKLLTVIYDVSDWKPEEVEALEREAIAQGESKGSDHPEVGEVFSGVMEGPRY